MARVAGKVALVTGAASGIGLACARLMREEGARVILADVQDDLGGQAARALSIDDGEAFYLPLDVSRESQWLRAVQTIRERFGRLDVLVNNAGIGIGGPVAELALEDWRRQQSVNLDGVFLGIKHSLPLMREGGGGSIVNISSVTAKVGSSVFVSYSAAKGGVRSLTKAVAKQCAALGDGVRVNAVLPGVVETPIFSRLEGVSGDAADARATAARLAPLGRVGQPEDIAYGVLYLASDEARYVTGIDLIIDGGLVIR
jgi:NAD(P)-dependent dehydrogenase (short-subunit alcohol dehydrogenase family)